MYQTFMVVGSQISPGSDDGEAVCTGDRRTIWSIIWAVSPPYSCAHGFYPPRCPWSFHTNGAISCAIERAKLMVGTILAPEFIVGWAADQFTHGVRRGKYAFIGKKSKLTMAHGFFLYATSTPPSPQDSVHCTLPLKSPHLEDSGYDVPGTLVDFHNLAAINPETIEDKSKGDAFSKTFHLQLSWFIVQSSSHHLLEMSALAFTGLSIITYLLWWYKPLNVNYHICLDDIDLRQNRKGYYVDEFDDYGMPLTYHLLGWGQRCFFGAFHCLAWSFSFPSHAEMVLWRVSSLGVLVWMFIQEHFGECIGPFSMLIYIVARIMLIALAFLQLRHLSPLSFCTVQWTTYIPHIY
ncbi:hypothetical protein IW261DRAFT_1507446 [Armillaria novae-zelandiae]|uniref:Uncharacterized protein n=1 Tax=Armillaria novae-zelandiae TaxID=153914 RepID=A0AA39NVL1_9AGAR|nr:hypothetical protein IW261DRAFT_1507446 [Armillaria novae-zelandiae]